MQTFLSHSFYFSFFKSFESKHIFAKKKGFLIKILAIDSVWSNRWTESNGELNQKGDQPQNKRKKVKKKRHFKNKKRIETIFIVDFNEIQKIIMNFWCYGLIFIKTSISIDHNHSNITEFRWKPFIRILTKKSFMTFSWSFLVLEYKCVTSNVYLVFCFIFYEMVRILIS